MRSILTDFLKDFDFGNELDCKPSFDLTTKEGLNGFYDHLDNMSDSEKKLLGLFSPIMGIDKNEDTIEGFKKFAKSLYDKANNVPNEVEITINKTPSEEKKVVDHTENEHFDRPSDKLTVDQKLQLHKLTQEYIDTMIKPYNKGILTDKQINDAYAGLYEFAAWILKK